MSRMLVQTENGMAIEKFIAAAATQFVLGSELPSDRRLTTDEVRQYADSFADYLRENYTR